MQRVAVVAVLGMWAGMAQAQHRQDPFQWPGLETGDQVLLGRQGPLTVFELDQLRVTGVVVGTGQPVAVVEGPNGVAHMVRVGEVVGRDGGTVVAVTSAGLLVERVTRLWEGRLVRDRVVLGLVGATP